MRRLTVLALAVAPCLATACNEYPVERCAAGEGIVFDDEGAPFLGAERGPVELTVFGDFQCPFTRDLMLALGALLDRLAAEGKSGKVRVTWRHFPLSIHNRARAAAIAAAAAARQGNDAFERLFWHLLKPGAELTDEKIRGYAQLAGLDLQRFDADLTDDATAAVVDRDVALGRKLDLEGTPGAILCGVPVEGDASDVAGNVELLADK
ncbi:MAG: thioredoxin domain-containing protein [Deltaproteobacteria bacterium]|nr:thioredoxin domain-containing protein [Deltaproteobacteria bacterium]